MARTRTKQSDATPTNIDPNHGHGGSYAIAGGVNHDTESEGPRVLTERTEHRIVRSAFEEEQARAQAESGE